MTSLQHQTKECPDQVAAWDTSFKSPSIIIETYRLGENFVQQNSSQTDFWGMSFDKQLEVWILVGSEALKGKEEWVGLISLRLLF